MEQQGIDLILASSRENVGYLSGLLTHAWDWDHAMLHAMERKADGMDGQTQGGARLDISTEALLALADRMGLLPVGDVVTVEAEPVDPDS